MIRTNSGNILAVADAELLNKRAVGLGNRLGLVSPGSELVIGGIPYVQVFKSFMQA
jgi:hypothetical protein